jgi:chemotaxis protein methyltransferase CheR
MMALHRPPTGAPQPAPEAREFLMTARDFDRIAAIVGAEAGIKLPAGKINLVYSRLAKRLRKLGLRDFAQYCALVADPANREEREAMIAALTTNVTHFFRERHHFDHLKTNVLPAMMAAARRGAPVRLWSAACSSGQEPYSIALTILSAWPEALSHDVKILATDIDPNMIKLGQAGSYDSAAVAEIPAPLRQRWFRKLPDGETFQAIEPLRAMIAFRKLNLIGDWPMRGRFHAIFCRNVVIYFDGETQSRLWSRLAARLAEDGALYIGHSERVTGPAEAEFAPDGTTTYRAARQPAPA